MEMNFPLEVVVGLLVLFGLLYLGDHRTGQSTIAGRPLPTIIHHSVKSPSTRANVGG